METTGTLEKHAARTNIITNVISILVTTLIAFSVGYGFFYDTTSTQAEHSKAISDHEKTLQEIKSTMNSAAISEGVSSNDIKNLKESTSEIKQTLIRLEDKMDKIILQTKN